MLERLVELDGKQALDIGCGSGGLVRELTRRGAAAVGLEITEQQLAGARERGGGSYLVGRAQALPVADATFDLAVFMRTLHHVPPNDLVPALREARRVLRPDGVVYVVEPLTEGDFFALTRLIDDELEVREAAQRALADAALAGLERVTTIEYDVRFCIAGLAALRALVVSVDAGRAALFDAQEARLAELFGTLGEPGAQSCERCFTEPMRADVLRLAGV